MCSYQIHHKHFVLIMVKQSFEVTSSVVVGGVFVEKFRSSCRLALALSLRFAFCASKNAVRNLWTFLASVTIDASDGGFFWVAALIRLRYRMAEELTERHLYIFAGNGRTYFKWLVNANLIVTLISGVHSMLVKTTTTDVILFYMCKSKSVGFIAVQLPMGMDGQEQEVVFDSGLFSEVGFFFGRYLYPDTVINILIIRTVDASSHIGWLSFYWRFFDGACHVTRSGASS